MKIGKYPVKHSYKIARLVSDVFSLGLAVLIVSVTVSFLEQYSDMMVRMGADNVAEIVSEYNPAFEWRQWLALIFPALVLAVFVVYAVLMLKSHPFRKYNVTKLTAQQCCDTYKFCASLCKIPLLLGIFDAMYIFHRNMLGAQESIFSLQILLDIVLIAIIIRFGMHRIEHITRPKEKTAEDSTAVKIKVKSAEKDTDAQEENK